MGFVLGKIVVFVDVVDGIGIDDCVVCEEV